ncbi:MAG: DUF4091 domain-containing protein [Clostridia bacterium]|nr:DUF4091 domain-containing protein [Clostridia bacterium]
MKEFEVLSVSSLQKVLPHETPSLKEDQNVCFKNEVFSFQVAYYHNLYSLILHRCTWEIESDIKEFIKVRPVKLIPCTTAINAEYDEYYLTHTATLMPDLLSDETEFYVRYKQWHSLWVTVKGNLPKGEHKITIKLFDKDKKLLGSTDYNLTVLDKELPVCDVKYAHWFHYDSIAKYYGLKVWSDEYNRVMNSFIKNAVEHGVNTLLVPLFTPPTNTYIGGERLTTQLVDVYKANGKYEFCFERLKWFMKNAQSLGVKFFEMAHLYTQWGAEKAPKIIVEENGKKSNAFGWKEKALGEKYTEFMKVFMPKLVEFLKAEGYGEDRVFFHISDEPSIGALDGYLKIRSLLKPMLGNYKIFDALSNYEFSSSGAVDMPVVETQNADEFLKNKVKNLWVYYCLGDGYKGLSNRLMAMPSYRARILGIQLYAIGAEGFLHWGYNYYNTALSEEYINPYVVTDAWGSFQSGDSFVVYPSKDGNPLDSLRHEVLYDGFQDYSALKMLEQKIGREEVLKLLEENGVKQNLTDYPKSAEWLISFRKLVNEKIINK